MVTFVVTEEQQDVEGTVAIHLRNVVVVCVVSILALMESVLM